MKKDEKRAGVWSSELSGFSSGGDYAFGYVPFDRVGNQHRSAVALAQQAQDNTLAQMAQSQEYNKENMALQNQYAIEAENRANEYNSPAAQIARADAAGISPLAALGMAGNVQTVSSAPSSSTPGAPGASPGRPSDGGVSLGDVARLAISGATGFANIEKSISSSSLDKANAEVAKATAEGVRIDNADKIWKRTLRPYIATKYKSEAEQLRIKAEFEEAVQSNRVAQFLKDYDIKVALESLYKEKSETEQSVQNLNEAKTVTEGTQQTLNEAKTLLSEAEAKKAAASANLTTAEYNHLITFYSRPGDNPLEAIVGLVKRGIVDGSDFIGKSYDTIISLFRSSSDSNERAMADWLNSLPKSKSEKLVESFIRTAETYK